MRRAVMVGRGRAPLSVGARRRAVRDGLGLLAAATLDTTFMLDGPLSLRRFYELTLESGYSELAGDSWPCEGRSLGDLPSAIFRDGETAVVILPDKSIAHVSIGYGWFGVRVASPTGKLAAAVCSAFRQAYPASYLVRNDDTIPVTFWSFGRHGPEARLRRVDSASWDGIKRNYTAAVKDELAAVMGWSGEPGRDGQLLLWQGPPGTGKTWALRALASEWAPWAEFHYITDPDAFFVSEPSYMVNVLLSDSYATIDEPTGDIVEEQNPLGKWRVLILEDTGELLAANAKEAYGQGLSRLLNVVDGMIGQGLRVIALVTTNDELGDLHPAVSRPGRCASQIEFGPLTAEEASEWLGETVDTGGTVAELYARSKATEAAEPLPEVEEDAGSFRDRDLDDLIARARAPLE